jgi:hypothetical protein
MQDFSIVNSLLIAIVILVVVGGLLPIKEGNFHKATGYILLSLIIIFCIWFALGSGMWKFLIWGFVPVVWGILAGKSK